MTTEIVLRGAEGFGVVADPPKTVPGKPSSIYRVSFADGRVCELRYFEPGSIDRLLLSHRMRMIETLADTGFATAWPQRTLTGDLVWTDLGSGSLITALQWLDASVLIPDGTAFFGSKADQESAFQQLGALIADLHLTAEAVVEGLSDFPKTGILKTKPDLQPGLMAMLATLDTRAKRSVEAAIAYSTDKVSQYQSNAITLIHGNISPDVVLRKDDQLYLVGLENAGIGLRMDDLSSVQIAISGFPNAARLNECLMEGYVDGGGAIKDRDLSVLPYTRFLRALSHLDSPTMPSSDGQSQPTRHSLSLIVDLAEAIVLGSR